MANKTIETIIILRNDASSSWASSSIIMRKGELGVSYLDNGNVIVKAGDGEHTWLDLPQVESVLEQNILLTHTVGKHVVPSGSFKDAGGKNMTFSEWFIDAHKETVEPTITQPSASLSATPKVQNNDAEIGSKITAFTWDGGFSAGSYKINSATQSTGLSSSNTTWSVTNSVDSQTSTSMDGTFTLSSDKYVQIDSESEKSYANVYATVTLDASTANTPKNNLGEDTNGKITAQSAGAPWSKSASVKATGYRKPFWGVLSASAELKNPEEYDSSDVRSLPSKGTKTKGFPSSISVPAGSQMVVFFAKAGAYTSLTATDDKAMNATVQFTKVSSACSVEGANGFTAASYDLWYVNWGAGIGAAKQLTLKWS